MLKAVLFDLGWTLVDLVDANEFDRALEAEMGKERYGAVKKDFVAAHRQLIPEEDWVRAVGEKTKATPEEAEKLRKKIHWPDYVVYPDTLPTLQMLRRRGLKIGLISNGIMWLRKALEASQLYAYFDSVTLSCEVGLMKPEKEIFYLALQNLDCQPSEAIMIGDNLKFDVLGAKNAGIRGILLDRNNRSDYSPKMQSLLELEDIVSRDA